MKKRIHILDDEPDMLKAATALLEEDGYAVTSSLRAAEALPRIRQNPPDILLLDIRLADGDGYAICRELKADPRMAAMPIMMISAKSDESDVCVGLEVGADDYVSKPFRAKELLARIRTILRRHDEPAAERLTVGPFALDFGSYTATINKKPLQLTPKEFQLLAFFLKKTGRVLTRATISESVWGMEHTGTSRTIDVHVDMLRRKVGKYGSWFKGLKGIGYRFDPEGE